MFAPRGNHIHDDTTYSHACMHACIHIPPTLAERSPFLIPIPLDGLASLCFCFCFFSSPTHTHPFCLLLLLLLLLHRTVPSPPLIYWSPSMGSPPHSIDIILSIISSTLSHSLTSYSPHASVFFPHHHITFLTVFMDTAYVEPY